MLIIDNLTKKYSMTYANKAISFKVKRGEIFGLLGPNGSGKTTLVSQIIGFLKPTEGNISLNGTNIIKKPHIARQLCSLQPQENISLSGLTPRQAIELTGKIRKGERRLVKQRTNKLLKQLQLEQWADEQSDNLSGGIRRLVTFCMAIIIPGKLVILDEPTNDVDPIRRRLLWEQVQKLANTGVTVLLITHNILEAEQSVDRLALIHAGKIIGIGAPASLKGEFNKRLRLELTLHRENNALELPSYVHKIQQTKQKITMSLPVTHSKEVIHWVFTLQKQQKIEEFSLSAATLEDAYITMIDRSDQNQTGGKQYATE